MKYDIHAASHAARDCAHYLAMAWAHELQGKAPGWPLNRAVDRLTEAAQCLGYTLVPERKALPAPAATDSEAA